MPAGTKGGGAAKAAAGKGALASDARKRAAAAAGDPVFGGHEALTPAEVRALAGYQGHSYLNINRYFRGESSTILPFNREFAGHLDAAVGRTVIKQDIHLYRGFAESKGFKPSLLKGMTIDDAGFASMTRSRAVAQEFGNILLKVKVPAGSKGLAVHKVDTGSGNQLSEHEVLMPRGSSVRITGVRKLKYNRYLVKGELVR